MILKNVNSDKFKLVEDIKLLLDKIVEELKLSVVGECSHQFFKKLFSLWCYNDIYHLEVIYLFIHLLMKKDNIRFVYM